MGCCAFYGEGEVSGCGFKDILVKPKCVLLHRGRLVVVVMGEGILWVISDNSKCS